MPYGFAFAAWAPQPDCYFMKLPTELRVMVYAFALQHIVDDVVTQASLDDDPAAALYRDDYGHFEPLTFTGALALPYTNSMIRNESFDVLWPLVHAHVMKLIRKTNELLRSSMSYKTTEISFTGSHLRPCNARLELLQGFNAQGRVNDISSMLCMLKSGKLTKRESTVMRLLQRWNARAMAKSPSVVENGVEVRKVIPAGEEPLKTRQS